MPRFSKSKLMTLRQCPKRLWLEMNAPALRQDSQTTQAAFNVGHRVGDIARQIYDPEGRGHLIDLTALGFEAAFTQTAAHLKTPAPLFEAGFSAKNTLAFADVMLPLGQTAGDGWRMVEVKSTGRLKTYHRDDAAIQAYVARAAGVDLRAIAVAHINTRWVYSGDGNYQGLLREHDLSEEAFSRENEVAEWVAEAERIAAQKNPPEIAPGLQCNSPYDCGFLAHCTAHQTPAEYPIHWLPRLSKTQKAIWDAAGVKDLRDMPADARLTSDQIKVKTHTLAQTVFFDVKGAIRDFAGVKLPAYFLDFETVQLPVPIWAGTRPYQQICFQFSLHRLSRSGKLEHTAFLDLSGQDPSRPFAEALLAACGRQGAVFVYNAGFEKTCIQKLAERFPDLAEGLLAINQRVFDLLPVARRRYYHPDQKGSWSIKAVLPAAIPTLRYDDLEGIQDGHMAMAAYAEAIETETPINRKETIREQLLKYCELDTYAMVRLWDFLSGRGVG